MASRTVTFKSKDLGSDQNLLLCFASDPTLGTGLYKTQFPVVWKVTTLAGTGRSTLTATYEQTLAFSAPQIDSSHIVNAGTYIPIHPGQRTDLTIKPTHPPLYSFSNPKDSSGATFDALNSTGGPTDIGVGFISNYDQPNEYVNTVRVFTNVGDTGYAKATFEPILSAYVGIGYYGQSVLGPEFQSETAVWTKNLLSLKPVTTWNVSRSSTGKYLVTEVFNLNAEVDQIRQLHVGDKVYRAMYRFSTSEIASEGSTSISDNLVERGYDVSYVQKGTDVTFDVTLPEGASCESAGAATVAAHSTLPLARQGILESFSASKVIVIDKKLVEYAPVDPCSPEWSELAMSPQHITHSTSHVGKVTNGDAIDQQVNISKRRT